MVAYDYGNVVIENYFHQPLHLEDKNYLFVWNYRSHPYVILVFRQQVWLADGVDAIRRNRSAQSLIKRYISKDFRICVVGDQQLGEDHCRSSAVLICLDLLRMMKKGTVSEALIFPTNLKRQLARKLHPLKTTRLGAKSSIQSVRKDLINKVFYKLPLLGDHKICLHRPLFSFLFAPHFPFPTCPEVRMMGVSVASRLTFQAARDVPSVSIAQWSCILVRCPSVKILCFSPPSLQICS